MSDTIQIRVDDMRVRALLERVQARMGDMLPVMDEIGSALLECVQRTFEREEAPGGAKWAGLAPSTILRRQRAKHWPGPILRVAGNLYRSINYRANNYSVTLGAGGPGQRYAAIHQFGGVIKRQARSQTMYFKISARGDKAGKLYMAKRGRSNFAMDVNVGAHDISIPARPYLFGPDRQLPAPWLGAVTDIMRDHLMGGA